MVKYCISVKNVKLFESYLGLLREPKILQIVQSILIL